MTDDWCVTIDELRAWGADKNTDELWPAVLADARRQWASAQDALDWLNAQSPKTRDNLVVAEVRCPARELLLRLYSLPPTCPAVTHAHGHRLLIVPTRRAQMIGRSHPGKPWWIVSAQDTWNLRCRCVKATVQLTPERLLADGPVSDYRVVLRV